MYVALITVLMLALPALCVGIDLFVFHDAAATMLVVGKWFVFWAVGVRLFLAGLRQVVRPEFTAKQIFGIEGTEPLILVQELGFANLSIGTLGLATIARSAWTIPAALVGGLFYGLAGVRHTMEKERNVVENVAMASDLFAFAVLLAYLASVIGR